MNMNLVKIVLFLGTLCALSSGARLSLLGVEQANFDLLLTRIISALAGLHFVEYLLCRFLPL